MVEQSDCRSDLRVTQHLAGEGAVTPLRHNAHEPRRGARQRGQLPQSHDVTASSYPACKTTRRQRDVHQGTFRIG